MKNIIIFVLASLLLLYSCVDVNPPTGRDGYVFHSKQYDNKQVLISVVTFKTWKEFRAEAERQGMELGSGNNSLIMFSSIDSQNPQICTIYMIDPETNYLPEFVGHEFLHCTYGQWHIDNESKDY